MTTASKITMVRVVLIPFFIVFLLLSGNGGANADTYRWVALCIFVVASLSDFLDGYVARHYNQVTDFGKFFDTLADKLLVTACLMVFVGQGRMASARVCHHGPSLDCGGARARDRRGLVRQDQDLLHDGGAYCDDDLPKCTNSRYGRLRRDFGDDALLGL